MQERGAGWRVPQRHTEHDVQHDDADEDEEHQLEGHLHRLGEVVGVVAGPREQLSNATAEPEVAGGGGGGGGVWVWAGPLRRDSLRRHRSPLRVPRGRRGGATAVFAIEAACVGAPATTPSPRGSAGLVCCAVVCAGPRVGAGGRVSRVVGPTKCPFQIFKFATSQITNCICLLHG